MANNSKSNQRGGSSGSATAAKSQTSAAKRDDNIALRAARTVRDRPYASAAIATGAVTAVAAAAAGAFFFTRRDKSFKEASEELTSRVRDGFSGAGEKVKELAGRGSGMFTSENASNSDGRTQQQIAEEALTLKETGAASRPVDSVSATEIKTGSIAY